MHEKLASIELARGIAALLIVCFHGRRMLALPQYTGYIPLGGFFNFGNAGVDFFFTLSGFIIYFVHHKDIGYSTNLPRYLWRRVTRIYPAYWLVTALVLAMTVARTGGIAELNSTHIIKSVLLLPQAQGPVLDVGWTLVHEMLFYSVFALAILSARLGFFVAAAWIALVLAATVFDLGHELLGFIASPYHFEFLMGAITAYAVLHDIARAPRAIAILGTAAFLTTGLIQNANLFGPDAAIGRILYGMSSSAIILGIATAERHGLLRVGGAGLFFGGASYSLYLIHTVVIGPSANILAVGGIVKLLPGPAMLVLVSLISILAGCALYKIFELPVLSILNDFGKKHIFGAPLPKPALTQKTG